ncbi:MAG: S9 family peptidase [Candidatus Neomarinimicrobiota bacterium]|nr:S9 family peptidase [Candidatus Neomarinimicrobiota bacterium]
MKKLIILGLTVISMVTSLRAGGGQKFTLSEFFELEYASDPQISPDGKRVVYVRNFADIMTDRRYSNLWVIDTDGKNHRPLTTGHRNDRSPRWSPDGLKLIYVSNMEGSSEIYMRWMDSGQTGRLTNVRYPPGGITWSTDGEMIAFSMFVKKAPSLPAKMPDKPAGAKWADPPKVIDKMIYRSDGLGYRENGYTHIFTLPAEGGTPRQLTSGDFHHGGSVEWTADDSALVFSANRRDDWEHEGKDSEVYEISTIDGSLKQLTKRKGPDSSPTLSPDDKTIAYTGYDDRYQGYQVSDLYTTDRKGTATKNITQSLDRSVGNILWSKDGKGIYVIYSDKGNGKIAYFALNGKVQVIAGNVGGTSIGRPYSSGSFTVSDNGTIAFTVTRPGRPADVAVVSTKGGKPKRITALNEDLFSHKQLASVEEIWYKSSHDGRDIQGWIAKPPGFDPKKKYPLLLEIHGGPFANYGDRFSAEIQAFAAAGYVVLYTNPRGSTSYGEEFGNLIHHAYPGDDFFDLVSGVDAVIDKGYIDEKNLFVTGGSGGGVLTAWLVGRTDRFTAAVSAKPVINWYSFVLTADMYGTFTKYWFPGFPWEMPEHYHKRSPLSLVGNVTTPTMLLTGEADYRTPMSESEQYYQALKLRKIDTKLVRIPGASHGIYRRPSQHIAKVAEILEWFEHYRKE